MLPHFFIRTYNQPVLLYDQQLYDDLYEYTRPDGTILRYSREFLQLGDPAHWRKQRSVLTGLGVRDQALIVGCGFSPLLTAFDDQTVWGCDPSPFIQEHKWTESDVPRRIMPYAVPDKRIRRGFKWIITDNVIAGYNEVTVPDGDPGQLSEFLDGCEQLGDQVIHLVTTGTHGRGHPLFRWRSLEQWANLRDHTWIDNVSMEVADG